MQRLLGPVGVVRHLLYAPDGTALIAATTVPDGNTILTVWQLPAGVAQPDALTLPGAVHALALNPRGDVLAVGGLHRAVALYEWQTDWEPLQMLSEWHTQQVNAVAFSPDDQYLISGTGDPVRIPAGGELIRWSHWRTEPVPQRARIREGVGATVYLPTGPLVFGDGEGAIHLEGELWAGRRPPTIGLHSRSVRGLAVRRDARLLLSYGTGVARLWRVPMPQSPPLPPVTVELPIAAVLAAAFHPTGQTVALAAANGVVCVDCDPASARYGVEQMRYEWPIGAVTAVAFAPDGLTAACAGTNGVILLWDID